MSTYGLWPHLRDEEKRPQWTRGERNTEEEAFVTAIDMKRQGWREDLWQRTR